MCSGMSLLMVRMVSISAPLEWPVEAEDSGVARKLPQGGGEVPGPAGVLLPIGSTTPPGGHHERQADESGGAGERRAHVGRAGERSDARQRAGTLGTRRRRACREAPSPP